MIELSSCVWIPTKEFTPQLRKQLTLSVFDMSGEEETEVQAFRTDRKGYVGIPRVFGLKLISNRNHVDRRSAGAKVTFPRTITLRDYQEPFVDGIYAATRSHGDFQAEAGTGKGKTVCALRVIQMLGRRAAVVVDQENLMDQWVQRITQHLGLSVEDIGIVRGPKATYADKPITICMMQTLTRRGMPADFYEYFGTVVFDESHTAGAPTFSEVLLKFSAKVRFGISATPDRRDVLHKVLHWSLGSVAVRLEDDHAPSSVYIMESHGTYSWRVNNSKMAGGFINEVADDSLRNLRIAEAAKWLYDTGRDVLVISDRVEHCCSLLELTAAVGVPRDDLGLYAKMRTMFVYEKDPRPPRRPPFWEKGTEYSPVRLALVQKTIPKKVREGVLESSRIIFATYGVMAKGVDVPRLAGGIDATPRSESTQVHGRVLRSRVPGKLRPIWITIADVNSFRSLHQLLGRLGGYVENNAEVFLWDIVKGRKRVNPKSYRREVADRVALLRRSRIITSSDGNNTLVIPSTLSGSGS